MQTTLEEFCQYEILRSAIILNYAIIILQIISNSVNLISGSIKPKKVGGTGNLSIQC